MPQLIFSSAQILFLIKHIQQTEDEILKDEVLFKLNQARQQEDDANNGQSMQLDTISHTDHDTRLQDTNISDGVISSKFC